MKDVARILQHVETIRQRMLQERHQTLGHAALSDWPYGDISKLCRAATTLATGVHVGENFHGSRDGCLSRVLCDLEHTA